VIAGEDIAALDSAEGEAAFQARVAEVEPVLSRWRTGAEAAAIERARAHLSNHGAEDVNDTVACLLIDHSGSLRGLPAVLATAVAEVIAGYWSRIGIKYEILGFTTVSWRGGRSREKWLAAGAPPDPGRLCDVRYLVYRAADDRGDGAPPSIRNLLREGLLKENIDGEAVAWAAGRLRDRPEGRKILVVVSDGAPVDDSTLSVNPGNYLERHLRGVIASINESGDLWLAAIGICRDPSRYYPRRVTVLPADEPSQVVNFVAGCTDVAVVPGPQRDPAAAELDDEAPAPAAITISATFLAMVAAFLGLAAITATSPGFQRFTTFPVVVTGWLISLCLHEFGHAVVAYDSCDWSVRDKGYLTLDPRRYVNFEFSIVLPVLVLVMGGVGLPGGAVYVNTASLSPSRSSLVSAAGPFATLLVLLVLVVVLHRLDPAGSGLYEPLAFLAFLQVTALVFNLLPLPGLDGWGIIAPWLAPAVRRAGMQWGQVAVLGLFVSLFIDPVNRAFFGVIFRLCRVIGLDVAAAMDGLELFRFWNLLTGH